MQKQRKYKQNEVTDLQKQLNASVKSGIIKKGSEEWLEMTNQILEAQNAVSDFDTQIEQAKQDKITTVYEEMFDRAIEKANRLKDKISSINDLITEDMMIDKDTGNLTEMGALSITMNSQQLDTELNNLQTYVKKRQQIMDDFANGSSKSKYGEKTYDELMSENDSAMQESLKNANNYRQSIISIVTNQANVSGSASYATSSDTANYINLVATNEIRFYKNQFKGGTVHFGYRWSDGSTSPLITEYRFNNGNGSPTQVTASQFNGNLNGIATRTTLLNPVTTSDTFTTGTSTWRNGITDGYVVWGQWWRDTNLTNDTANLTIWIRKEGTVTSANMTIDGTIYAVGGFNGNATSATKLQTARKIGNASFDGTADISLSSIGAASSGHTHNYASTLSLNGTNFTVTSNKITVSREQLLTAIGEVTKTANGYMSAADKAKLDNINVSDIGTVGANSIKGTGYINVSILKGVATISHGISGVTAGTYGADSTNNFTIPKIVVDSTGHITSASAYSVTAANIVSKLGTTAVNRATADSDGNAINTTYLKLSGGTMTGNISYKGTKATYDMITFIDNPNDTYGNGIAIGGGGTVIIGGGESSDFCKNNYISDGGNERLILANDGMIDFYVNCQEGSTSKAVHTYIDTTGKYIGVSQKATQLETSRNIFGKSFNGTSDVAGQAMVYGWYNSNAENRYASGGLQIRENNCVQNKQSDIAYAPSIGFNWSNRIAATLLFHSDGIFYFRKQNYTDRATIDANLNAGSIATTTANIYGTATFTNMSVHNGGIKSGLLHLQGTTSASIAYGANNPKIKFVNSDGSQIVELMYTDYDSVRWPAGLAVRGNQGNEYFDVPHLYASQVHVDNHCALQYDSSNQCLNFVFS